MESKYYTPEITEFHVGFEYEYKPRERNGIIAYIEQRNTYLSKWEEDSFMSEKTLKELLNTFYDKPGTLRDIALHIKDKAIRVKHLDREDIESLLNEIDLSSGKKWKHGKQFIKGDAPKESPWVEFILEDASTIILNEYLQTILIEKTFPNGRGKAVVFNGIIKNKSELKRILKQIEI